MLAEMPSDAYCDDMPIPDGATIRQLRTTQGWLGVDFAHEVGISHSHLANLESPQRRKPASDATLAAIAGILGVDVDTITEAA